MSNVNDNNLDDLLRRAAEKYPLRTDSANFDKLMSDLEKDPSLILPPVKEDRRKRRFFWLFFLLPLAGGAYYAWHTAAGRTHEAGVVREQPVSPVKETVATTTPATTEIESRQQDKDNRLTDNTTENNTTKNNTTPNNTIKDNTTKNNAEKDNTEKNNASKDNIARTNSATPYTSNDHSATGHTAKDIITKDNTTNNNRTPRKKPNEEAGKGDAATAGNIGTAQGNIGTAQTKHTGRSGNRKIAGLDEKKNENEFAAGDISGASRNSTTTMAPARTPSDHQVSLASTKNSVAVNIPVKAKTEEPVKKSADAKDKIKLQKPKPSFYVGIMGSPDLSVVRFQSIKAMGSNFGLLLGYSFNSRWAVETGVYYDRKKYYTNGEYFSKSKAPRLQDVDLKTVDGVCNMWEIPLNVRYNFSSGNNKMKWFATGGLSTYLMSKEKYSFTGYYWGNPNWNGTYTYKTPYQYWFSILNLSVGYEQRLGKIGNLRLEPFVRVPLAGIGTGSLSIMSAGLNIGITRRIW
ncbi:outer membrane beta-barrel protein [Flavitalea sp. BT771]|uniref:outer membrane beta-barrel protein n=1 Tax=Flavitalea sp. BT771 TaxID=3063329 RepID=UPI0026E2C060|nr:outer membrane beta-barrel protein [Flavitalea sp. BT771]MDO6430703.1 outer membrane beta-barrel protein [Flavitalea sp. BT771]MDV6219157.1 outer membrane beta-barrel protein [Flavitalea sp. BT771]